MNLSPEGKKAVIDAIKAKLSEARSLVISYENDLIQLEQEDENIFQPQIVQPLSYNKKPEAPKTFKEGVLAVFKDGFPKTSRELLKEYNKLTGKNLDMGGMSAQLSPLAKKGLEVKKIEFPELPFDRRNYYGLADWFDGDKLKAEYMRKIKNPKLS
jgi:hypothetical protein